MYIGFGKGEKYMYIHCKLKSYFNSNTVDKNE